MVLFQIFPCGSACVISMQIYSDFFNMRKHFHLIGHFLKNAQSSENMYEIFFGPLKNAQLSENACPYPRASILT